MPAGKAIKYLRADSASYQADIINFCEKENIQYVIGADLDKAVIEAIEHIPKKEGAECLIRILLTKARNV